MIYVAGQPAPLLEDNVAIEDALHLVPVEHPALRDVYPAAVIPAGTYYPWQPEAVPTVAPRAVLMTSRWTDQEGEACRVVGKIARIVADNLDRLRHVGHPKWREVDLAAEAPAVWQRSPCVVRALAEPEGYVLNAPEDAIPSGAPPSPPGARMPAPPGPPAQQPGASASRACSAEANSFRRHLCEVRQQLGAAR
jgi:hypothetical protein